MLTLDLLLALVPLTIIIGISANAIAGVASQAQEYVAAYGGQRVAIDAADVLVKTAGEPYAWDNSTVRTLGFAIYLGETGCPFSKPNTIISNVLDASKLSTFSQSANTTAMSAALKNLSGGSNIRILITNSTSTVVDVMGYKDIAGTWRVTSDSATINSSMANATDLFLAERTVGILEMRTTNITLDFTLSPSEEEEEDPRAAPAVGDLDSTGNRELVIAYGDSVYAYYSNGTQMWRYQAGGDEFRRSSPALADLNGDGKLETIIGSKNGKIYAIYHNGTLFWSYSITSGQEVYSAPAVGDVDADGYYEIIAGVKGSGRVVVLNNDGSLLWSTTTPSGVKSSAAIADLSGDGSSDGLDFVIGAEDNKIYAFKCSNAGSCSSLWNYTTGGHVHSSPAARDIDGDGIVEVVVGSNDKNLYVLNGRNGSYKWSANLSAKISSSPALGDLNGDGKLDVVFGSEDNKIYAYSYDGTKLWEYTTGGKIKSSSPALADLDSDCKLEVVIGSEDKKVYALNHDGTLLWSYTTGDKIQSSPVIADLNGDGYLDVIIPSEKVYVFDTPGSGVEWPTFHQCLKRAGYYYDSICAGPNANTLTSGIAAKAVNGRLKVYIWR